MYVHMGRNNLLKNIEKVNRVRHIPNVAKSRTCYSCFLFFFFFSRLTSKLILFIGSSAVKRSEGENKLQSLVWKYFMLSKTECKTVF